MKLFMTPVRMISITEFDGTINPIRFQLEHKEELITIKVDNVSQRHNEKLPGIPTIIYKCKSVINNMERVFELKYEVPTHKWFLYKLQ